MSKSDKIQSARSKKNGRMLVRNCIPRKEEERKRIWGRRDYISDSSTGAELMVVVVNRRERGGRSAVLFPTDEKEAQIWLSHGDRSRKMLPEMSVRERGHSVRMARRWIS